MDADRNPTDSPGIRLTRAQLLSVGGTVLVSIGGLFTVLTQKFIEGTIDASFHRNIKELDLALERRSAFEDRVLTDRYEIALELIRRLDEVLITYNRASQGITPPEGFLVQSGTPPGAEVDCGKPFEIVPLTDIYRDLEIHLLLLGNNLHGLLWKRAALALRAGNLALCPGNGGSEEWTIGVEGPWLALNEQLRKELDAQFGLSQIRWDISVISSPAPEAAPTVTVGR
jgi:hypothetical protein